MHTFVVVAIAYLVMNFALAVLFHVHGLRQAHLAPRFLDVLMHFLLFSALALPLLLAMCCEEFFGQGKSAACRPLGSRL